MAERRGAAVSWSADFIAALDAGGAWGFVLSVEIVGDAPGVRWDVGSHPGLTTENAVFIAQPGPQVQGASVSPRGWTATLGGFRVPLTGDLRSLRERVARGAIVSLYAGPLSMAVSAWGRIALGQVRNIRRGSPGVYVVEAVDLMGAFRSRLERTYGFTGLFSALTSTTLTANEAVGSATYDVTTTTGFDRETGGNGAILVTPTTGDPYYRVWSSTTANTFTIDSPATASVLSTTDVGATSGDTVAEVAYLTGHPISIALKVLTSTGAGTNGPYDTYPESWSLGIRSDLVDIADAERYALHYVTVSSGSYDVRLAVTAAVDDGWSWLQSTLLAPMGLVAVMRQGSITIRAGRPSTTATGAGIDAEITDGDLVQPGVLDHDWYSSGHSWEYNATSVDGGVALVTTTTNDTGTLPGGGLLTYDLNDRLHGVNDAAIATDVRDRVYEDAERIPERLVLLCRLWTAALAPLDVVRLSTRHAESRRGDGVFDGRLAVVDEVSPDWVAGTCRVGLLVYPDSDSRFAA